MTIVNWQNESEKKEKKMPLNNFPFHILNMEAENNNDIITDMFFEREVKKCIPRVC